MPIVLKSGSLNLLEPSGPVQACNGIALPLYVCMYVCMCIYIYIYIERERERETDRQREMPRDPINSNMSHSEPRSVNGQPIFKKVLLLTS